MVRRFLCGFFIICLTYMQSNDANTIPGPKSKTDRIAIIGAGSAGVHMAYLLQKEGFTDIVIFEQSNRIGGKSYSVPHRGVKYEMGTCFAQIDYGEIFNLVEEFNVGSVVEYPDRGYWISDTESTDVFGYLGAATGITDRVTLLTQFADEVSRYGIKLQQLFGDFEGELMPRPNATVMKEIRGTFKDYLDRNNFVILKEVFRMSHTVQGYGYVEDVAALYGLMWMTRNFTNALFFPTVPSVLTVDVGFQTLWEEMVRQLNLNVKFGISIDSIKRGFRNGITIDYQYKLSGVRKQEKFDFLILTPDLPSLKGIVDFSYRESRIISKLTDKNYFVTTLIDSSPGLRTTQPISYHTHKVVHPVQYNVWAKLDKYAAVNNITGDGYKNGLTQGGDSCTSCQSAVFYQFGKANPKRSYIKRMIDRKLRENLVLNEQEDGVVIKQTVWPYFIRFPPCEIEKGIIWDVVEMQGTRNTWYTGASVSFESVKSVTEYNKMLIRMADLPD